MTLTDTQRHLIYLTGKEIQEMIFPELRAVTAEWKNGTIIICFYYEGEISDLNRDAASDACTYVVANFPDALLQENFTRLDYPNPLPTNNIAYLIKEDGLPLLGSIP